MQSHLLKSSDRLQTARGRWAAVWDTSIRSCGLACEQFVLLGPVERQVQFAQPRRGQLDGLAALQDRLDELRAQEGEADQTANVAPGNPLTLGQHLERSGAAGGELLKPRAPARNRLDQRRVTSSSCGSAAPVRAAPVWFRHRAARRRLSPSVRQHCQSWPPMRMTGHPRPTEGRAAA